MRRRVAVHCAAGKKSQCKIDWVLHFPLDLLQGMMERTYELSSRWLMKIRVLLMGNDSVEC